MDKIDNFVKQKDLNNLLKLLRSKNEMTRLDAIRAICKLGDKKAIPDIERILLEDDVLPIREEAAKTLGE